MIISDDVKKIGIISDTHNRLNGLAFDIFCGKANPDLIYEQILFDDCIDPSFTSSYNINRLLEAKCDLILHAGDIGNQLIIDQLESIADVHAVNGNCDFNTFSTLNGSTKDFEYFEFFDLHFAMAHRPEDLHYAVEGSRFKQKLISDSAPKPDVMVHGHTHYAEIVQYSFSKSDKTCIEICPGSATQGRYGSPNSVALLYVTKGQPIMAQLLEV